MTKKKAEKQEVAVHTYTSVRDLYNVLIGDAIVIQPVGAEYYDIIDVAYDMALHFHERYHTPLPRTKCLTRRNLTLKQCILHAEECIKEVRKTQRFTYPQHYEKSGTRQGISHGAAKEETIDKSTGA